jgi:hypothetical protein
MSTLKTTYLQHPSAASANVTLASDGKTTVNGAMVGAGLDLVAVSTFSAASSVSLNGCFSTSYQNYRIVFDVSSASASTSLQLRFRAAGTDNSTSSYVYGGMYAGVGVAGSGQTTWSGGATSLTLTGSTVNNTVEPMAGFIDAFCPFESRATRTLGCYMNRQSSVYLMIEGMYHAVATAYDGFSMFPGSGTITGNIRVYGLRNA